MATQIRPLSQPPLQEPMQNNGTLSVPWSTWFTNVYNYAKGPFTSVASGSNQGVTNTTFFAQDTLLVSINLPLQFNVGDEFRVVGSGTGGWQITQNDGQIIHSATGSTTTGVGGSLASGNRYSGVTLVGVVENVELALMYHEGPLTFV